MGLIPQEKILEVKESSDIVEVISEYVSLKKAGMNFKSRCPFHEERTPSFIVSPGKQIFHCFGCGIGGNVFHFISKFENLNFIDAVKLLAKKNGINLTVYDTEKTDEKEQIFKLNDFTVKFFRTVLDSKDGKVALEYLTKRNINRDSIEKFLIGYAPDSWDSFLNYAKKNNFLEHLLEKSGLIIKRENTEGYYGRFRNRIIFPILNNYGRVCAFGARVLDDSLPKYINSPESPVYIKGKTLYGWSFAKNSIAEKNNVIIVEGYLDCVSCHQSHITNVVATLGTALTKEQAKFIKRYTEDVIISYDVDMAGVTASVRGIDLLIEEGLNVRVTNLPAGKDPDELLNKKGKEEFLNCINNAKDFIDYLIEVSGKEKISTLDAKIKVINQILPVLTKVQDAIKFGSYVEKISRKIGIEERFVWKKLEKTRDKRQILKLNSIAKKEEYKILYPYEVVERDLLQLVLSDTEVANRVKKEIFADDFSNADYSKILKVVFDYLNHSNEIQHSAILDLLDEDLREIFTELVLSKKEYKEKEKAEKDFIKKIRENRIRKRLLELEPEVKKLGKEKVDESLVKEYFQLQKYLKGNKSNKSPRV